MGRTKIAYLDKTWNVITGCTKCGEGCRNCWAEASHTMRHTARVAGKKLPEQYATPFSQVVCHSKRLHEPMSIRKPSRVGVCYTGDWLHNDVPTEFIDEMLEVISACPRHQFFSLTKRVQNIEPKLYGVSRKNSCRVLGGGDYFSNLWIGASAWDQASFDNACRYLRRLVGWNTWISLEPMIGAVTPECHPWADCPVPRKDFPRMILAGGDHASRTDARVCNVGWLRSMAEQCEELSIKFYLKQLGTSITVDSNHPPLIYHPNHSAGASPDEWPEDLRKWHAWPLPLPGDQPSA